MSLENNHVDQLIELGFSYCGPICISEDDIQFKPETPTGNYKGEQVYAWVERIEDRSKVVYVGRCGGGVKSRFNTHRGGFKDGYFTTGTAKGQESGRKLAGYFRNGQRNGRKYSIYARASDVANVFGQPVSLSHAEERVLIERFQSPWNSEIERKMKLQAKR
ncbi:hypothetical protein HNP46_006110 [Pseudomonas nitritireducens]|uniref:GIY-YIG domain-containing protein n=1 Tax=Pseudomonas nitroreducens TaxID=46680 RepID=A0A7W7P4S5_PSENT|nr:hypothetical protein [Pseudomonas nitritireducens]MBB4867199.1 hypothetical protein [Pseudomonas nitritireducens]